MVVHVRTENIGRRSISARRVHDLAQQMLNELDLEEAELSILLCGDTRIRGLNRDYRGKDCPTDVLAFSMREGPDEISSLNPSVLGDVVISLETARRQAQKGSRTIVHEVAFLLAHGILHLLGFDHQNDEEEREMNLQTTRLVDKVLSRNS